MKSDKLCNCQLTVSTAILYFINTELPTFRPSLDPGLIVRVTIILVVRRLGVDETKTSPEGNGDNITEVLHRGPTSAVCRKLREMRDGFCMIYTPADQALPGLVMISGINQIKVLNSIYFQQFCYLSEQSLISKYEYFEQF